MSNWALSHNLAARKPTCSGTHHICTRFFWGQSAREAFKRFYWGTYFCGVGTWYWFSILECTVICIIVGLNPSLVNLPNPNWYSRDSWNLSVFVFQTPLSCPLLQYPMFCSILKSRWAFSQSSKIMCFDRKKYSRITERGVRLAIYLAVFSGGVWRSFSKWTGERDLTPIICILFRSYLPLLYRGY